MAFKFGEKVNPKKPINKLFPPPHGWRVVDAYDYTQAHFGQPSRLFTMCEDWEKAEIERIEAIAKARGKVKKQAKELAPA